MASRRRPRGSYVRSTGDWLIAEAATVGGTFKAQAALSTALDLYNNSDKGEYIHVYDIFVMNDAAQDYGITHLRGHGANFMQNGVPVIIGNPSPGGQLYYDNIPAQYSGFVFPFNTPFSDDLFGDNEAGTQDHWCAQGPLRVIPPGFSVRVYTMTGSGQTNGGMMTASFYYLVLPDMQ